MKKMASFRTKRKRGHCGPAKRMGSDLGFGWSCILFAGNHGGWLILTMMLLFVSVSYSSGWAEDRTVTAPVSLNDQETLLATTPLFYSYESGQWITSSTGKIFTTADQLPDFTLPFLKEKPEPIRYPRWALDQGWEGDFIVAVEVLPDGSVGRWEIMHSSGHRLLDLAAVRAIQTWRFEPAKKEGRPIVSCIQIPIRFLVDKD